MGEKYAVDEVSTEKLAERIAFPESAAKALAFDLSLRPHVEVPPVGLSDMLKTRKSPIQKHA
jgi:hypothetical protein